MLVEKAKLPVLAVLTDLEEMLSLGLVWDGVLACVEGTGDVANDGDVVAPPAEASSPGLVLGEYRLRGSSTCCWGAEDLRETLSTLVSYVDLAEPFERIREAIQEAQRVTEHPVGENDEHSAAA